MRLIDSIGDYVKQSGWTYKGSCNCGGMLTYKYELKVNDSEYKLKVRATSYLISTPGSKFKKYPISELKNMINEINECTKESV